MLGIVTFPFERRAMVYFCDQFLGSGLTEKSGMVMGDPHPSRLRRSTFPQGKASTWNVRTLFITENIPMQKGFSDNEEHKTLAFPLGEGGPPTYRGG